MFPTRGLVESLSSSRRSIEWKIEPMNLLSLLTLWSLERQVQTVTNRWILLQFKHSTSIEDINIVQFLQFKHSASTEGINIVRTCCYDGWKLTLCALHVSYLTSGHCDDTLIWSNVRLYVLMWPNMTCYIGYGMNYLKRVWRSTFTHKANVWGWSKPSWCKQIWQYILLPDRFHSFHWAFKCRHLPDDLCWKIVLPQTSALQTGLF